MHVFVCLTLIAVHFRWWKMENMVVAWWNFSKKQEKERKLTLFLGSIRLTPYLLMAINRISGKCVSVVCCIGINEKRNYSTRQIAQWKWALRTLIAQWQYLHFKKGWAKCGPFENDLQKHQLGFLPWLPRMSVEVRHDRLQIIKMICSEKVSMWRTHTAEITVSVTQTLFQSSGESWRIRSWGISSFSILGMLGKWDLSSSNLTR